MPLPDDTDSRELFDERAAIMEYTGGLPRRLAEYYAAIATRRYVARTGCAPPRTTYYETVTRHMTGDEPIEPVWPEPAEPWRTAPRGRK